MNRLNVLYLSFAFLSSFVSSFLVVKSIQKYSMARELNRDSIKKLLFITESNKKWEKLAKMIIIFSEAKNRATQDVISVQVDRALKEIRESVS